MKSTTTTTGKVFGIGLSRTGAQTLNDSLEVLGYRSHFVLVHDDLDALLPEFDAFTHLPLVEKYAELDERFPNSKFILTVRERESWLQSCDYRISQSAPNAAPASFELLERIYGTKTFDRAKFSAAYDRHYDEVNLHFQGRDNLLILDLCGGEGFEKLCPFLEKDIPQDSFPYSKKNSRAEMQKPHRKLKRLLVKYLKADQIMHLIGSTFKGLVGR